MRIQMQKNIINEKNKDSLQNVSFKTSNLLGLVNTYNQHDSTKNKLDKCEISQDESSSCKMLEEKFKNEIQHSKVKKPLKKKRRTSFKLKNYKPNKNKKYFKVKSVFKEKETLKKEIKEWFVLFNKANAENYKRNYKKAKRKKQLLLILIQTKVKII
ncbi:hypothetical protein EHP00_2536 [Ecytonucleospora hepatopenaei]|uniref:Uncharacterized protein n=1 Tax=Ecytonucleospora hepatopenaei TaxID=646526 RepID=A0A1W0E828_9MICR|nr:hypothetical protein EHP00_2536 [Ecytonucleospora hepatopenaei]